ncbi:MAG: helix-turn-helix transcriptional regulator [Myxococcota bacterium]
MSPPLQRARPDVFARAPFGKLLVGPSWLVWASGPDLIGSSAWGSPSADELGQAFAVWDRLWTQLGTPLALVTDVRHLSSVPGETFTALAAYVRAQLDVMRAHATRHLVIVNDDESTLVRTLGVGFLDAMRAAHPFHPTSDVAAGAAWLGHAEALARVDEAARAADEAMGEGPFLRALRAELERRITAPRIDLVASALGISSRTLQRRLAEHGTSLRDEVTAARCRIAARLLVESDEKIAEIGRRVGIDSASHFASVFKRHIGVGPSEHRAAGVAVPNRPPRP